MLFPYAVTIAAAAFFFVLGCAQAKRGDVPAAYRSVGFAVSFLSFMIGWIGRGHADAMERKKLEQTTGAREVKQAATEAAA